MERLTSRGDDTGTYRAQATGVCPAGDGYVGPAIDRLGAFEDVWEELLVRQQTITRQLADLRAAGKEKSAAFRQLFAEKLQNSQILLLWESHGLR